MIERMIERIKRDSIQLLDFFTETDQEKIYEYFIDNFLEHCNLDDKEAVYKFLDKNFDANISSNKEELRSSYWFVAPAMLEVIKEEDELSYPFDILEESLMINSMANSMLSKLVYQVITGNDDFDEEKDDEYLFSLFEEYRQENVSSDLEDRYKNYMIGHDGYKVITENRVKTEIQRYCILKRMNIKTQDDLDKLISNK